MKRFVKEFREFWTNLSLNIRDYFIWVFNYKKLSEEWKKETKQNILNEIHSNRKIEKLNQERDLIQKEKDNLIKLRDNRIRDLNSQVGKLRRNLSAKEKEYFELKDKLEEKEKTRRSLASKLGGIQGTIKHLEKELKISNDKIDELNNIIQYLKNNRKSPNLEELKAYEYSRKEVLKRQNEKGND